MTIYVDSLFNAMPRTAQAQRHGTQWCHLTCDGDLAELHRFALKIGLKREWFQRYSSIPHYDLTPGKRAVAVKHGAVEQDHKFLSPIRQEWMSKFNRDWGA